MSSPSATDSPHARNAHDALLLQRVAQGDQSALGELYDRWSPLLHALIASRLSDPAEIEDALHQTFITLWEKAGDFDPTDGSAYNWATTLTHDKAACEPAPSTTTHEGKPFALSPLSVGLRVRILNSAVPLPAEARYLAPFPTPPAWLGWVSAALLSVISIFFAAKSFNVRGELQAALESERVARIEAVTLKNVLEAERILSRAQLEHLRAANQLISELRTQLPPAAVSEPALSTQ